MIAVNENMILLFVCTGNTCRSPMAEALFNHRCPSGYHALSAGVKTRGGKPISENSRDALNELGIEATHESVALTDDLIGRCDRVYGMTKEHTALLKERFPLYRDRVFPFPNEIGDPYGCDLAVYRRCRDEIAGGIDKIVRSVCHVEQP